MNPVKFKEQTITYAEGQPQYLPLPAHRASDGRATFCWRLSWRERFKLLLTGHLWHSVLTFKQPLQPQLLSVDKPVLEHEVDEDSIGKAVGA